MYTDTEIEKLSTRFRYDEVEGKLYWKARPLQEFQTTATYIAWHKRFEGKEAGTVHVSKSSKTTYRITKVDGKMILVHRIIWAIVYGEWPTSTIDHIDMNGLNNKIGNLRLASNLVQARNKPIPITNSSGALGVSKKGNKWQVGIGVENRSVYIGTYESIDDAIVARKEAELKYWGIE